MNKHTDRVVKWQTLAHHFKVSAGGSDDDEKVEKALFTTKPTQIRQIGCQIAQRHYYV